MAGKQVNIDIKTKADTSGADKAAKSLQNISTTTTVAANNVVKGSNNMAFAVGNVGNQLQDIAVQAQSGTSAVTILAQQGPQLLSGFGPQGAIAGSVLALGALILSTMIKSTQAATKAAEDAWTAADEFAQKTADAFKKAGGEEADAFIEKAERINTLTQNSATAEINLANQQRERIKAQGDLIKSQEDLAIASVKYLQATGQIEDAEKRIAEIQGVARDSQRQLAEADIMAAVKPSEIRYKTILDQIENAKNDKKRIEQEISDLQSEQSRVNRLANISRSSDKGLVEAGVQKQGYQSAKTSQFESQLAKLEGALASLQKQSDRAPSQIQSLIDQSFVVAEEFDQAQKSAAAQIQEANQKFNVAESTQQLNEGVATITAGVQSLKENVGKLEPINAQQQQAKSILESTLSDSKLTADEMLKNAAALQVFQGTIKVGQEGTLKAVQEMQKVTNALIASNNALVAEAQRQAGIIKTLPVVNR